MQNLNLNLSLLDHIITYWPVALVGSVTGLIGWIIWCLSISVSNTRWRKAIQTGRYVETKTKDFIREQKVRILILEKEVIRVKKQNIKLHNVVNSMTATAQKALLMLTEEEEN